MSSAGHRTRHNRKLAIAKAIVSHPGLTDSEKRLALHLLRFADENGVIHNQKLNAYIDRALREEEKD
jgi:hypothetical protein